MKKILVVLNNTYTTKYEYLSNNYNNIDYIRSSGIIEYTYNDVYNLVINYDIIFMGGGPQHLTDDKISLYPEFENLFNIIKICENYNIILLGICLGFQIICYYYNCKVVNLNKLNIGTNYLDINSLNNNVIISDQFLSKINFSLIKQAFSFHYDSVVSNDEFLDFVGYSINNIPYIVKHKFKKIYGFQFHPELTKNHIKNILDIYKINFDVTELININQDISKNFFESLIN